MHGFRLLQYSEDSFTFATPAQNYGLLCDTVANLSSFLAEKMDLAPLDIREESVK